VANELIIVNSDLMAYFVPFHISSWIVNLVTAVSPQPSSNNIIIVHSTLLDDVY